MIKKFEFEDNKSSKFWNIKKEKLKIIINFGRIGSEGRKVEYNYDSKDKLEIDFNKKITSKTQKGYKEIRKTIKRKKIEKDDNKIVKTKKTRKVVKITKSGNDNNIMKEKRREKVYDIPTQGVMLAHNYTDPRTGKKKNPVKGFPTAPFGWYLSEKFDGYRAIWDGKDFRSRGNNIFNVPEWFKCWMPGGIALDGELFLGRENFEKCGIFRKKNPDDQEWINADVKYHIFDAPSHDGLFNERYNFIKNFIRDRCKMDRKNLGIKYEVKCPLILTEQIKVSSEKEVSVIFERLVNKGAEGIMLRAPNSPYEGKRSAHLLKYKQLFDSECKIIGYKKGTGKYKDLLGSFRCELVKDSKIKFDISGMNDDIRKNYLLTHPIGTIVTFTYMGLGKSGIPRHPQYLRIRRNE